MTYIECKEFTKYFLKNYKSPQALKDVGSFILTIMTFVIIGALMALLLHYSWWNIITIIVFGLSSFYVGMIWLDWKYRKPLE